MQQLSAVRWNMLSRETVDPSRKILFHEEDIIRPASNRFQDLARSEQGSVIIWLLLNSFKRVNIYELNIEYYRFCIHQTFIYSGQLLNHLHYFCSTKYISQNRDVKDDTLLEYLFQLNDPISFTEKNYKYYRMWSYVIRENR